MEYTQIEADPLDSLAKGEPQRLECFNNADTWLEANTNERDQLIADLTEALHRLEATFAPTDVSTI